MRHAFLLAIVVASPAVLSAQSQDREWAARGPFLSAAGVGGSIQVPELDGKAREGNGVGGRVGYAFTRRVAAFGDVTRIDLDAGRDEGELRVVEAGVQLALLEDESRVVPVAELAAAHMALTIADFGAPEATFEGYAVTAGLAVQLFVVRDLAVGARVRYSAGVFRDAMLTPDGAGLTSADARMARFSAFVTWQLPLLR